MENKKQNLDRACRSLILTLTGAFQEQLALLAAATIGPQTKLYFPTFGTGTGSLFPTIQSVRKSDLLPV